MTDKGAEKNVDANKKKEQGIQEYSLYKNDEQITKTGRKYSDSVTSTYIDPLKELDKEIRESFYDKKGNHNTDFFKLSQTETTIDEKTQVDSIDIKHEEFFHDTIIENMEQYGFPTVLCESKNFVVVGLTNSVFYIFDKRVEEDCFAGGADKLKESGKVSAIAINHDEVIMAVGFENGDIAIYELKNNYTRITTIKKIFKAPVKIIQFVSEYHPSLKEQSIQNESYLVQLQ